MMSAFDPKATLAAFEKRTLPFLKTDTTARLRPSLKAREPEITGALCSRNRSALDYWFKFLLIGDALDPGYVSQNDCSLAGSQ